MLGIFLAIETDKPAGALVITDAAIRTKDALADLTPAAVLLGNYLLADAPEFMAFRDIDLVAVTIRFFESLGYHFGYLY